ncbi:aminopeptidase ASCRUDRAFT_38500 [Ascoidea rubescens DSM 1968]|uniref:Aminopeptidase P N-terminal domain-containing protein n=1 Tax=Ascoidea rubescens DSM 1968 TaxID=1344418 RepID=A0A1D2VB88_9ASCO|nr:hypothetical protein ASCRUDRAFT_38500 [Ascoidea rubescens DSM 1968]ODV58870.1 hypothetical protein ASCRUDRAFT_38500 [Ascoidea rubescens DSM 1968]
MGFLSTNSSRALASVHRISLALARRHFSYSSLLANSAASFCSQRPQQTIVSGQPLHETRPAMLKSGELTPGITAMEYFERRLALSLSMENDSIAIVPGNTVKYASGAVFYEFQQDTQLYYLTGWNEPDSLAILEKNDSNANDDSVVFHLLVPPKNEYIEKWEGHRTGVIGAKDIFNADESTSITEIQTYLDLLISRNKHIYCDYPATRLKSSFLGNFFGSSLASNKIKKSKNACETIDDLISKFRSSKKIHTLSPLVDKLRAIKSPSEIKLMRQAGKISGRAFNQAYHKRFKNERTLASFLEYKFILGGCSGNAYIPVVAGGPNALSIHYTRNDDVLYDNEMVLVDAAGQLGGYRSDISRTWPVNGRFTGFQGELYEVVLNVNRECIKLCSESNNLSLSDIHRTSSDMLYKTLSKLTGFQNLTRNEFTNKIYPHSIGHNLGLDVHDVPNYSSSRILRENQVVTIEPGIYIPDDPSYPSYARNVGIRIEDNVVVGKSDYTVLTIEAVKEIADIENIAKNGVTTVYEDDVINIRG